MKPRDFFKHRAFLKLARWTDAFKHGPSAGILVRFISLSCEEKINATSN
jgi:hypothetical protein